MNFAPASVDFRGRRKHPRDAIAFYNHGAVQQQAIGQDDCAA
jgi:hypothetical protein